jgi:raffinose/stachyose/melibiose transport system substrate-binding protein
MELGDENLGMIPIYFGVDDENEGLVTGTENYWCVNKNASKEDIQATLDFMNWCVTDEDALKAMCGGEGAMPSGETGMGFVIPFKKCLESENALVNIANQYVEDGKDPITWNFTTMPSEEWKNDVGSALTTYAADQSDKNWDAVQKAFVDGWATEAQAAK